VTEYINNDEYIQCNINLSSRSWRRTGESGCRSTHS